MTRSIEVLFSPVEFCALSHRNLGRTACVVLDILRAELELTMRQCGTPTLKQITRSTVQKVARA